MRRNIPALFVLTAILSMNSVFAGSNYNFQSNTPVYSNGYNNYYQQPVYPQNNTLSGSVVMVPAGLSMPAILSMPISSETAMTGQQVIMSLSNDFYYNNKLVAPAGSTIVGTVIEVSKARRGSINGRLCVRFNQIMTPSGMQIPISAVIRTDDSSGVLIGGTKMDVAKEYAKDVAGGSAAGALSGVIFGALSGGNVGRGAALGTAVGAGGGLVKSVWDKGSDVEIPVGASVDIVLTQPITVSSYIYEN